jgi:hypothetical protein
MVRNPERRSFAAISASVLVSAGIQVSFSEFTA